MAGRNSSEIRESPLGSGCKSVFKATVENSSQVFEAQERNGKCVVAGGGALRRWRLIAQKKV